MDMNWRDVALGLAGAIGCFTAVIHGVLVQRLMVRPIGTAFAGGHPRVAEPIRRIVPALLQFSTFNWIVGGLALIAAALWFGRDARLAIGLLVGSAYLFGAVGNLWGTRGLHPGWMLMAVALGLIGFGLSPV